jgi:hypothetical protein
VKTVNSGLDSTSDTSGAKAMNDPRRVRILVTALILPQFVLPPATALAGIFGEKKCPPDGPITLKQAAAYVDMIDRRLFAEGTVGVKVPDVWGQNRMTVYRAEYETQMATRLGQFQQILQAAQNRTDISALTSATSLGATVAAAQSAKASKSGPLAAIAPKSFLVNTSATPAAVATLPSGSGLTFAGGTSPVIGLTAPPPPAPAPPPGPTPADPGNPDFAGMAAQLAAISARIDTLKQGTLTLPTNINNFVTQTGQTGVGIEPAIGLDQEAGYINHLHQLRRVNAGDDLTDLAGYGLYLMRMPVTLMPGPESRKGKGAIVTVEARHDLTDDLLPNTFRDVAILDLTYALTQIVNEQIHQDIYLNCHPAKAKKADTSTQQRAADQRQVGPQNPGQDRQPSPATGLQALGPRERRPYKKKERGEIDTPNNVSGPFPILLRDMQLILGSIDEPLGGQKSNQLEEDPDALGATTKYQIQDSDRLFTLVESMKAAQRDPYRHDPSTLSLFQASILDAWRYMRENAAQCPSLQVPRIEALAELLLRHDYVELRKQREQFLWELYCYRNRSTLANPSPTPPTPGTYDWADKIESSDILAFALLIQFINVDRQLKWDMKYMAQRRGCNCGEVDGLCFYEFDPSPEARNAFKDYVACKWPLHVYSVDPVLDQQNVLDAYSRRTELQLALAVAVATGQFNIKNATSYARQLDLDLQTVGLNRTSVGFGAGETTFGWMFYPRVQTPQPVSNFRNVTNLLTGTGQGINADLRSRRIEPGQRECIALIVTPNFIPQLRVSTVTNWFDITGHCAQPRLTNQEMIGLGRMLQQAKAAVAHACDSGEYRPTDFVVLNQRIKQLEALLPTQDTRVDLPDEGDLLGSEIFSPNAAGLSPSLLAWYGEPVQDGTAGSIFLMGRGFSVSETQVIVGGQPLIHGTGFRLISRNVMQIIVPPNARSVKMVYEQDDDSHPSPSAEPVAVATLKRDHHPAIEARGGVAGVQIDDRMAHAELDPKLNPDVNVTIGEGSETANARGGKVDVRIGGVHARAQGTPKTTMKHCELAFMDVHIATPNGISNHLYVEVIPKVKPPTPENAVTTATTTTTVHGNTTTTTTRFETTPPGTVLPPLTVLPMGTNWPPATVLAPGPINGAPTGSLLPGLVPTPATTPATPVTPGATPSLTPPATPPPTLPPLPTTTPPAAPPTNTTNPPAPPRTSAIPAQSSAGATVLAGRVDNRVGVAAFRSSPSDTTLPPLPVERPRPTPPSGATSPKSRVGPSGPDQSAASSTRPPILRRIGLPDR